MKCPTCGQPKPNKIDDLVKPKNVGDGLKSLAKKRPDTVTGGMSRGGKYARN